MSLINDALKRASKSDRDRPPEPPAEVYIEPVPDKPHRSLVPLLVAGIVVALGFGGWIFWQWWDVNHWSEPAISYPVVGEPSNSAASAESIAPKSVPAPPPQVAVPSPAPATAPAVATFEPAWPAELKLMGIFFSKTNPQAIINGQTFGVGSEINGISVTKIENDRVTVEWHGKVKQLMVE